MVVQFGDLGQQQHPPFHIKVHSKIPSLGLQNHHFTFGLYIETVHACFMRAKQKIDDNVIIAQSDVQCNVPRSLFFPFSTVRTDASVSQICLFCYWRILTASCCMKLWDETPCRTNHTLARKLIYKLTLYNVNPISVRIHQHIWRHLLVV